MRHVLALTSLVVALAIGSIFVAWSRGGAVSSSKEMTVTFSRNRVELIADKPSVAVKCEVDVVNPTSSPVSYTIRPTCGYTNVSPRSGELAPSARQTVSVTITAPEFRGATQAVTLLLHSAEGGDVLGRCDLAVLYPSIVKVSPNSVVLKRLISSPTELPVADLEVVAIDGGDWLRDAVATSRSDVIECTRSEKSAPGRVHFRVSAPVNTCSSVTQYDSISLASPAGELWAVIPVRVEVEQSASLIPSRLYITKPMNKGS